MIRAPFTPGQVETINRWQKRPDVHPLTCPHSNCRDRKLIATTGGLLCPCGVYRQDWAPDCVSPPEVVAEFDAEELFPRRSVAPDQPDYPWTQGLSSITLTDDLPVDPYMPGSLADLQNKLAQNAALQNRRLPAGLRGEEGGFRPSPVGFLDSALAGGAIPLAIASVGTGDGRWFGFWFIAFFLRLLWVLATD